MPKWEDLFRRIDPYEGLAEEIASLLNQVVDDIVLDMDDLFPILLTDEEERTILEVRAEIASRVMDNARLAEMFEALYIPDVSKYTPAQLNKRLDENQRKEALDDHHL